MDLSSIVKSALRDNVGMPYRHFVRTLRPRWGRVAFDLSAGLVALWGTGYLSVMAVTHLESWWPLVCIVASVAFGYWIAYLQLFMHEGAHFNLAATRKWNDRLCDWLIGVWVGMSVKAYRLIHWEHHRCHGQPNDSEHSYFAPLGARFLLESLFGIKAIRVLLSRSRRLGDRAVRSKRLLVSSVTLHVVVSYSLAHRGHWSLAVAWVIGLTMFFPLFGALRQLLEHRSVGAIAHVDYSSTPHGKMTRMFKEGPIGSTFGAAGFTRHLLHHWDPSVSYTNLADVEKFLARCTAVSDVGPLKKTTYLRAFVELYGR